MWQMTLAGLPSSGLPKMAIQDACAFCSLLPGLTSMKSNESGETPLYYATMGGQTECVRLLLAAPGIDVNKANQNGDTPLHKAASNGIIECVRLLLDAPGINVNRANQSGKTPLNCAIDNYHTECARLIREAGGRRRRYAGVNAPPIIPIFDFDISIWVCYSAVSTRGNAVFSLLLRRIKINLQKLLSRPYAARQLYAKTSSSYAARSHGGCPASAPSCGFSYSSCL